MVKRTKNDIWGDLPPLPLPPLAKKIKFDDLSWPLKIAVVMGLVQFVCLVIYLFLVFIAGFIWLSVVM